MNEILELLTGGDLRSDGRADEVADKVIANLNLIVDLAEGLNESDDLIRARTAHALEKVSRTNPELLLDYLPKFIETANSDENPMVKWHLAMIFGNLSVIGMELDMVTSTLFQLLEDVSVFVRSWSISSLCIIGRVDRGRCEKISARISDLQKDKSAAIRSRASKAIYLLENEQTKVPRSWLKSKRFVEGGAK